MALHTKNYLKIKRNYDRGLWDKERVYNTVGIPDGITPEEYKQITGDDYAAE